MRACARACVSARVREREAETLTSSSTDGLILIIVQQRIGSPRRQFKDRLHATEQQDKDICLSNGRQQSTIYSGWQTQLLQLLDLPLSLPLNWADLSGLVCLDPSEPGSDPSPLRVALPRIQALLGMFQPQPTPYSSFYPAYLPVGVEDDGLSDGFDGVQASGYSTYPQAPFASLSLGGPGPQVGVPGPPASGSGPAGGSCHDAHGGAAGVPVDVRSAPLPVFPFNSTLPLQQHHQPGAPNLFDHRQPPSLQRQQQQRRQQQQHHSPSHRPASRVKMEQNQGLPDDFAAQEAAARTWEPEVEVRLLPSRPALYPILPCRTFRDSSCPATPKL